MTIVDFIMSDTVNQDRLIELNIEGNWDKFVEPVIKLESRFHKAHPALGQTFRIDLFMRIAWACWMFQAVPYQKYVTSPNLIYSVYTYLLANYKHRARVPVKNEEMEFADEAGRNRLQAYYELKGALMVFPMDDETRTMMTIRMNQIYQGLK